MEIETKPHALSLEVCTELEVIESPEAERDFIRSLKESTNGPLEVIQTSEREPIAVRHDEVLHRIYDGIEKDMNVELDICTMGIAESSKVLQRVKAGEKTVQVNTNINTLNILAMSPVAVEK